MENILLSGSGRPQVQTATVDASNIGRTGIPARICVIGVTNIGTPYVPTPIDSWAQFVNEFGGLHATSKFPLMCKRALEAGAKLYVVRVAHWDTSTWEGTKATATITQAPNSITFTAKEVGAGYNGISIQIKAAKSRDNTKVDIVETYNGVPNTIYDVNITSPGLSDSVKINNGLKYTSVTSYPSTMPIGTATLANGAQTFASIVDNDYIGNPNTDTLGLYAFDEIFDSMRIFNLDRPTPAVDAAFIAYCEGRQDMRACLCVPATDAVDVQDMVDYREGSGAYSHTAFNSWYADMVVGNILVQDTSVVGNAAEIRAIGDIAGLTSTKDREVGFASSVAGPNRGVLANNLGVSFNLDKPSRKADFDYVYSHQLNPVIQTPLQNNAGITALQTVLWGNRTLYKNQNSKFRYSNVADLLVYMRRGIYPILKGFLFEPNQPKYWYAIYAKVKPFIQQMVALGYIMNGENTNWQWRGDQNAKDLDTLVVNNKADIELGIYRAELVIVPTTLMEQIGFTLKHTDSETVLEIIEQ